MPPENMKDVIEKSSKIMKYLQSVIALVIVVVGLGVNWGMSKAQFAAQAVAIEQLQQDAKDEESTHRQEMEKVRSEIIELKLKDVKKDEMLKGIDEKLDELRDDVKKLLRGR